MHKFTFSKRNRLQLFDVIDIENACSIHNILPDKAMSGFYMHNNRKERIKKDK